MHEFGRDTIRFGDTGRPVAVGDQELTQATQIAQTDAGFWGIYTTGDSEVVVVHPGGAFRGQVAEVRARLAGMAGDGGLAASDREAAGRFLAFVGDENPGPMTGPRSQSEAGGLPPTYWLSGAQNVAGSDPGPGPSTKPRSSGR